MPALQHKIEGGFSPGENESRIYEMASNKKSCFFGKISKACLCVLCVLCGSNPSQYSPFFSGVYFFDIQFFRINSREFVFGSRLFAASFSPCLSVSVVEFSKMFHGLNADC